MRRNLDGAFFRVERDGEWQNFCFSDLTVAEREAVGKDRPVEWWKNLAMHLAWCLSEIGEEADLVCGYDD